MEILQRPIIFNIKTRNNRMKTKLLKLLRKKAKNRTWLEYSKGFYYAHEKSEYSNSCSWGNVKLETALRELGDYRKDLILNWVKDLKEKKINKEIRDL